MSSDKFMPGSITLSFRPLLTPDLNHNDHMASPPIARIGDVQLTIVPAANEHLVPLVAPRELSLTPAVKKTLRWMMQKEKLGQDVFLIGPPGPLRRSITFKYAQITQREIEYVCISRDITEGDLKQRREIANGTVQYVNQCCVRAAIEGRILILDGVQNCERNVLPLLNNLLENREMALEDGSFLVHPKRYAALTDGGNKGNVAAELADRKLIPVHPRFFVVALGLPVPPFAGYPLDPPFRSRFQARFVASDLASPDSALKWAIARVPTVSRAQLQQTLAVAAVFHAPNAGSTPDLVDARLPMCPADPAVAARLHAAGLPPIHVLAMLYPWGVLPSTSDHTRNILESVARRFGLTWEAAGEPVTGPLSAAVSAEPRTSHSRDFVVTASFAVALAKLHAAHAADLDVTVVGAKGGGKSHLVRHFVAQLSAASLIVPIYRDMSARDLLQRRVTSSRGDTLWEDAPLVEAMRDGRVAILDGVDALAPGSLGTLERLITNRSAVLPDGTSLVSATHFDRLPAAEQTRVVRIHPDFRIIAIARSTGGAGSGGGGLGGTDKTWISPDTAALMPMVVLPLLPQDEEMAIVRARVPQASDRALDILTRVAGHLATSADEVSALSHAFSLRTLIKIARHVTLYPNDNVHALVHRTTMAAFTPQSVREQLDVILAKYGIVPAKKTGTSQPHLTMIDTPDGFLEVDKVRVPIKQNSDPLLIPHTLFYDNDRQLAVIRDILKDYLRGEHLLLIGNQGTGKNRISDHLCARLRLERQYIQLHRDTTVQALTAVPVVRNGVLSYEDSPLVIAARLGHVLMVDEADKAPTHVTAILKTLVEDGEMRLGDGRRILSDGSPEAAREGDIVLHPEFRMIVLANRPGFPFLGNDFFRECGDVFACHPVENPDVQSEVAMLERYAPTVARPVLERLARAFAELRDEAQSGTINYPYSTREIVNIVKCVPFFFIFCVY
ncbi:AAA domain-containing protein [Blastocladiella britannica]|nr:AAA domain-containing protein [Blastocladiella britannica]